jgi:hypothetical protein
MVGIGYAKSRTGACSRIVRGGHPGGRDESQCYISASEASDDEHYIGMAMYANKGEYYINGCVCRKLVNVMKYQYGYVC